MPETQDFRTNFGPLNSPGMSALGASLTSQDAGGNGYCARKLNKCKTSPSHTPIGSNKPQRVSDKLRPPHTTPPDTVRSRHMRRWNWRGEKTTMRESV